MLNKIMYSLVKLMTNQQNLQQTLMINQQSQNTSHFSSMVIDTQYDTHIEPVMRQSILQPKSLSNSNVQSHNNKNYHQNNHTIQNRLPHSSNDFSSSKTQRQLLLQKRKSYADSIRSKNKAQIQSNNLKNINKKPKLSLDCSRNLTFQSQISSPANRQNQHISQLQKQYYSTVKLIDQNAFRQINPNGNNQMNMSKQTQHEDYFLNKIKDKSNCNNARNSQNNDFTINKELHSYRESYSNRKKTQNKENYLGCSTHRKNSTKNTSYAEIFDKKNTMNTLLNHQRGKNLASNQKNQNSKKKDNFSISSISSLKINCQNKFQNSHFLDKFEQNVNGFMMEEFNNKIDDFMNKIDDISNFQCAISKIIPPASKNHSKLSLSSQVFYEKVDFSQKYEQLRKNQEKQISLLSKQNATFKRELATFRKQNSNLKKQIQNYKRYAQQLQQKANFLLQQQKQYISSNVPSQKIDKIQNEGQMVDTKRKNDQKFEKQGDQNLVEILKLNQKESYFLRENNKALELRVFILQKRLAQEQESSRKKLAMEMSSWRDKYNKLKNQNVKLKHSFIAKPSWGVNLDSSISMQISRDQQA